MELQTDRLSLRRPTTADVDAIFAVHRDPETCAYNPSDALARFEEAEALYRLWDDQEKLSILVDGSSATVGDE
ncbi:hypothetical protein AB0D74_01550 [Streptomyces sp. NPDC048278]|uniref:GNAT family N-acetyltransferase n=1 Tax=Streptomyces sp. NPDC048278 TaxID=3155809 RepID=UPI00343FF7B3